MSEVLFARTHELKSCEDVDGGWIMTCWCGTEFGSSFAFVAMFLQSRHALRELRKELRAK